MERAKIIRDLTIIILVSTVVFLWNLGTGSLCSWDEGLYGGVSQSILKTGNWIDLQWAGSAWNDKPPLYMWMTAIFSMIFGMGELSVRLFSAICGISTAIIVYFFTKNIYSRKAGFAASLILVSTWHFIWSGKMGMLDVPLTLFITLSLFLFKLGEENKKWLFFSMIAFALAFLTKGMGAVVIPIILGLYILLSRNLKIFKEPYFILGIITSLAILAWWHMLAYLHYKDAFIQGYFVKHIFVRTTQAIEGHTGSFFTYFKVMPNKGRPWAGFCLTIFPFIIWRLIKRKHTEHLLPVLWISTILILYSLVKTKLHWYIIPVYPPLAMIAGWLFAKLLKKRTGAIVFILSITALSYLGVQKKIFSLDYSPLIKQVAVQTREIASDKETVFLYNIGDPGIQFYLGDIGKNIRSEKELNDVFKSKNNYILLNENNLISLKGYRYKKVFKEEVFILIKTK